MTTLTADSPIFVFSAGWRSGSTMVQRLLTASGEVLIWGEAGGALDCFADAHIRYLQMLGDGSERYRYGLGGNGAQSYAQFKTAGADGALRWIACMNPEIGLIEQAFRDFLEQIYGRTSRQLGYGRWGVKDVRSGLDTARTLRRLYPSAKFVFLVRDPLSSMASIKRYGWMDIPRPREALVYYARHWKKLAAEFREADFGMCIRYEDLVGETDRLHELCEYLELENVPRNFLKRSRVKGRVLNDQDLSHIERIWVRLIVGSEMAKHGY